MSQTNTKKQKEPGALDNYRDFDEALMAIHRDPEMHDEPFLEVTEELFSALTRGQKTPYLTVGQPGVKVFKIGTRDSIESEEAMPAEAFRDLEIKRKRKEIA
jgi:hypothetical protein